MDSTKPYYTHGATGKTKNQPRIGTTLHSSLLPDSIESQAEILHGDEYELMQDPSMVEHMKNLLEMSRLRHTSGIFTTGKKTRIVTFDKWLEEPTLGNLAPILAVEHATQHHFKKIADMYRKVASEGDGPRERAGGRSERSAVADISMGRVEGHLVQLGSELFSALDQRVFQCIKIANSALFDPMRSTVQAESVWQGQDGVGSGVKTWLEEEAHHHMAILTNLIETVRATQMFSVEGEEGDNAGVKQMEDQRDTIQKCFRSAIDDLRKEMEPAAAKASLEPQRSYEPSRRRRNSMSDLRPGHLAGSRPKQKRS